MRLAIVCSETKGGVPQTDDVENKRSRVIPAPSTARDDRAYPAVSSEVKRGAGKCLKPGRGHIGTSPRAGVASRPPSITADIQSP
jgi:hypothetical protein